MKIPTIFQNSSTVLLLISCLIFLTNNILPLSVKSFILGVSLAVKEGFIFFLPVLISSLVFRAAVSLSKKAAPIFISIVVGVLFSNFLATSLAQLFARITYSFNLSLISPPAQGGLEPYFSLSLPTIISNDIALLISCLSGLILGKHFTKTAEKLAKKSHIFAQIILQKITLLIPIFFTGFFIKIIHDKALFVLWEYAPVIGIIVLAALSYFLLLFVLGAGTLAAAKKNVLSLGPSLLSGLTTMSCAASLPIILKAISTRSKNKNLTQAILPSIINIHLLGDCIAIPVVSFAILKSFGAPEPSFSVYIIFSLHFVIRMLSAASLPGGSVFIMLPLLEKFIGLQGPMLTMCATLYLLFDPIMTMLNLLGSSAFTLILDRWLGRKKVLC